MKYIIDINSILEFAPNVIDIFEKHKQHAGRNEAGGILLGRCYRNKIVIENATSPSKKDKAGPTFFDRNRKRAQLIVNDEWEVNDGERIYLGEWHTHSELHPIPSKIDKDMIYNMLKRTKMEIDFLFTVIVGTLDYWVGIQKGKRLTRLKALGVDKWINGKTRK
jgi:integrative and conjugative element protein (TIGR02256 family)